MNARPPVPDPRAHPSWPERLVRLLDDGWTIPGTHFRVGLDGILGLFVPLAGDTLTAVGSLSLFYLALRRRVPRIVLLRMALNIALDTLIGVIPVVGDVFDLAWRSNRKNLTLIERAAADGAQARGRSSPGDFLMVGGALAILAAALIIPFLVTGALLAWALSALG